MKTSALSLLTLFMAVMALSDAYIVYINYYDEVARMYCPANHYMHYITSIHSNRHEDRRWGFQCRAGRTSSCSWTGYVNDFDGLLAYTCPGNKVVTGIYSYHNNKKEDRRFKFRCCNIVGKKTDNCYFASFANGWDGRLTVNARNGYAIKGAASCHSNSKEDRRWKFLLCRLR